MPQRISSYYHYLFYKSSDPRTKGWFLMDEPLEGLLIILIYLSLIYSIIPAFMEHRRPYVLKSTLLSYNILQILGNIYLVYGILSSGWFEPDFNFFCENVDYSSSQKALRYLNFIWLVMIVKIAEFLETILFALRKKRSQITFLHVYHHISTFVWAWIICKYYGGGSITIFMWVNSVVHILMYSYYFLAALGSKVQHKIAKFKPWLTMIQIVQFLFFFYYIFQGVVSCPYTPLALAAAFTPNVGIICYMFIQFYKNNYSKLD